MRSFKSKWFQRFVRRESISDEALVEAVNRAMMGQIDADLGGDVIKQRIARPGEGRSGGYRVILFFRHGDRAFFIFGFAKKRLSNIGKDEEREFRAAAKSVLSLSERDLKALLDRGEFVEVQSV